MVMVSGDCISLSIAVVGIWQNNVAQSVETQSGIQALEKHADAPLSCPRYP